MTTTPQAALLSRMDAYLSGNSCEATAIIKDARDLLAKLQATQEPVQTTGPWDHDFIAGRLPRPSHHTTQPAAGADVLDAQRYRWLKGRSQVCLSQVWFGGYTTRQRDGDFLSRDSALSAIESAIDAAMRKDKP